MKIINKILLSGLILGSVLSTKAQTVDIQAIVAAGTPTNILATNINVTKITVLSATANVIRFYDAQTNYPWALLTYSNQAYTNWTSAAFTTNVVFTNSLGRVQTNTYVGVANSPAAVAAGTNSYPLIGTIALSAGTPYVLNVNWNITRQLWFAGTNAATVAVEYW